MLRFLKPGTTIEANDIRAKTKETVPRHLVGCAVAQHGSIMRDFPDAPGRPQVWGEDCKKVTVRIPISLMKHIPGIPSTTVGKWVMERIQEEAERLPGIGTASTIKP